MGSRRVAKTARASASRADLFISRRLRFEVSTSQPDCVQSQYCMYHYTLATSGCRQALWGWYKKCVITMSAIVVRIRHARKLPDPRNPVGGDRPVWDDGARIFLTGRDERLDSRLGGRLETSKATAKACMFCCTRCMQMRMDASKWLPLYVADIEGLTVCCARQRSLSLFKGLNQNTTRAI